MKIFVFKNTFIKTSTRAATATTKAYDTAERVRAASYVLLPKVFFFGRKFFPAPADK